MKALVVTVVLATASLRLMFAQTPSATPSVAPSASPATPIPYAATTSPTIPPTASPSYIPTQGPSISINPTISPTLYPSETPSFAPTINPTVNTVNYAYTGNVQSYQVTTDEVQIQTCGGKGGDFSGGEAGGAGGCISAIFSGLKGETLYVYVGGQGVAGSSSVSLASGGYNGGGNGNYGSGGGGASDVRTTEGDLSTRLIVAAGGGGGGISGLGGCGGGSTGCSATTSRGTAATGGTGTTGGTGGEFLDMTGGSGSLGYGGAGSGGAGGGGGYYGGGGGGGDGGGGGGSSYTAGAQATDTAGANAGDGYVIIIPFNATSAPSMAPSLFPTAAPFYVVSDVYSWNTVLSFNTSFALLASSSEGVRLAAAASDGIYTSSDEGAMWTLSLESGEVWRSVAVNSTGELVYAAPLDGGNIWKTIDGRSWLELNSSYHNWSSIATDYSGKYVVAACDTGLWASASFGDSWENAYPVEAFWTGVASDASGQYLLAVSVSNLAMFRSQDYGSTWQELPNSVYNYTYVASDSSGSLIAAIANIPSSNVLYSTNLPRIILVSNNSGDSFFIANAPYSFFAAVAISGEGNVLAASAVDIGVYISLDRGATWALAISSYAPWCGVTLSANGSTLAASSSSGQIFVASMQSLAPTKKPTILDDDDRSHFIDSTTLQSIVFLCVAILPAVALIGAKVLTRVLRRRFQEKISALRSSWSDTLEIGVKCFTWLFLVLDICTNPTNAGTTILIASRVPIVAAWAIIILLLFQYGEPKAEDSGMSFGSASSGSTSRALAFLRQYLYAPALTSNTLSQSVKDIFWYGVIIVIALFDLGLFADLPWKKTDFVTLSRGYPTLFVARSCLYSTMGANILQSLGSVVTFLMESKRSLFGILFMLFAAFNAVRSIVDVLLVFLMLKLLKMKEREAVSTIAYTSRNVSRDDVESMDTSLAAFRPTEIELRHSTYADRKNHIGADVVAVHQSNPIHKKPSYLRRTQGVHIDDSDSQEASVGEYRSKIKSADETNEVLRSQLIKAGIVPLEYIPLTAIKAELKVLFDAINNDRSYDEGRLDYLLMCMDLNPEYKAEKEEEARRWRAEIEPFALECLATMRGFIPPHVFSATEKSLAAQYGYSTALSKRILHKKCLWLLRMHPDCIDRVHEAELMGRFNPEAQNLDIVELAAIYAVLPLNFHKDPFEKKAKWRQSTEDALKKMVQDKNSGKLSKEKLRCAVYAGQHPAFYGRESLHSMEAVASVDAFLPRKSFLLIGSQRSPSTVYNVSGPSDSRSERSRGSLAQMAERASSAGVQNSTNDRHTFATSEELEKHLVLFEEPDGSMLDSKEMQSNTDTVSPTPLSKEVRGLVLTLQRQLNEKKGRTTS